MDIDRIDQQLLNALQDNARLTISELADQVNLSVSGVKKRLSKLEEKSVIIQYATHLDRGLLGLHLLCFVEVMLAAHQRTDVTQFDEMIQAFDEVLECHRLTGGADYLLKIVVRDREHLDSFLMDTLLPLPAVDKVQTSIVLKEVKETTKIPVEMTV